MEPTAPQQPTPTPPEQPVTPPTQPSESVPPETSAANPFSSTPAPASSVIGSDPNVAAVPASGKSPKKLIILLVSIIGGLIVLGVAAIIVYFMFFAVSQKDYQDAITSTNKIKSDVDDITSQFGNMTDSLSGTTTDSLNGKIDDLQKKIDTTNSDEQALAKERALHDGDVKAKYDAFAKKYDAFNTYATNYATSLKLIAPGLIKIVNAQNDKDLATLAADYRDAEKSFEAGESAPDADVATFSKSIANALTKIADALDAQDQSAYFNALDSLNSANDTYQKSIDNAKSTADPTDSFNALVDVLNSKIKR